MLLCLLLALTIATDKVEPAAALSDPSASAAMVAVLEAQGYQVSLGGSSLCDIWLRKDIPVTKRTVEGANYPELAESELIGVIRFSNLAADFR